MSIVERTVPTVSGTLTLTLTDGSTCYDLTADNRPNSEGGPVTVYLGHRENRDLMADTGGVLAAMDKGTGYAATVTTMAGVMDHLHPVGILESVLAPGATTYTLTVDDGHGGQAAVSLDQRGAEELALGGVLMVGHL